MSVRRTIGPVLVALSLSLVPATALAAPVTVGQMPSASPPAECTGGFSDVTQSTVAAGRDYVVPSGYTELTSWSTFASEGAGQEIALKVFHPFGSLKYEARADVRRPLTPGVVNTFPAEIHVAAGDVIGLNTRETSTAPNGCVFSTGNGFDVYGLLSPGLDVGETGTFTADSEFRVNVVATLAAEPVTNAVSPSRGPASGGTEVVIAGHDLTGARQVNFGSAFAAFSVESDNAIRAVSPAGTGTVDVTVTTAAGKSAKVAADKFTYTEEPVCDCLGGPLPKPTSRVRCVVPKLKGKKLKGVREALKKAHCKLGKVTGPRGKLARVKTQGAKAGARLPAGSKVGVKLALG